MADLTPYQIAIGDSSYPATYAAFLAYLSAYLTEIETARSPAGTLSAGIDARILAARFSATLPTQSGYEGLEFANDGVTTGYGASAHGSIAIINYFGS